MALAPGGQGEGLGPFGRESTDGELMVGSFWLDLKTYNIFGRMWNVNERMTHPYPWGEDDLSKGVRPVPLDGEEYCGRFVVDVGSFIAGLEDLRLWKILVRRMARGNGDYLRMFLAELGRIGVFEVVSLTEGTNENLVGKNEADVIVSPLIEGGVLSEEVWEDWKSRIGEFKKLVKTLRWLDLLQEYTALLLGNMMAFGVAYFVYRRMEPDIVAGGALVFLTLLARDMIVEWIDFDKFNRERLESLRRKAIELVLISRVIDLGLLGLERDDLAVVKSWLRLVKVE